MAIKMLMLLALLAMVMMVLGGCGGESQPPQPAASTPDQPPPQEGGFQPAYTLSIDPTDSDPPRWIVNFSASVNTGGWKLTTDRVLVEEVDGKRTARVYAILEQPGPGEMVTQAMQTLTAHHDAGAEPIEAAELSIKRQRRGQDGLAMYTVVKRLP